MCDAAKNVVNQMALESGAQTNRRPKLGQCLSAQLIHKVQEATQAPEAIGSSGIRKRCFSVRQKTRNRAAWSRSWNTSFRRISPCEYSVIIMISGASLESPVNPVSALHLANASSALVSRDESLLSSALIWTTT